MSSPSFELFTESLHSGDAAYRDNFDVQALLELSGQEREQAEDLLIQRLTGSPDPRVVRALGYARSQRALPDLEYALATSGPTDAMRAELALALHQISGDPRVPGLLRDLLAVASGDMFGRNIAACALVEFPGAQTEAVLEEAIRTDPAELVRINAATSLFKLRGLPAGGKGSRLSHVWSWMSSDLAALRERGLQGLLELLADQAAGRALDPWLERPAKRSAQMKEVVKALRANPDDIPSFPEAAVKGLQGLERRHGVHILLAAVARGDARAPEALGWLDARDMADVLAERLGAPGALGLEVATTLYRWNHPGGRAQLQALAGGEGELAAAARRRL